MKTLGSIREAKEFLVGRIVAEAEREGVPLSEVERKMLYFSETGWTLPDRMEANAEFDRDYDQDEYEAKIAGLIQSLLRRTEAENEEECDAWAKAVEKLREEDHYLLVMIDAVPPPGGRLRLWLPALSGPVKRSHGDGVRLLLAAFAGTAVLLFLIWLKEYLRDRVSF